MDNGISHIRVESADQLFLLQGSKYVHSHIKSTYIQAKEDLRMGKQVLFTGTPCQIAGLKSFLKKDYENLLTVDLVCHGVPSQRLLFDEIKDYDYSRNLVSFRELEGMFLKISSPESGNLVLRKTVYKNLYYTGFLKSLFYRDSCYTCPYADSVRCSDITIGDFWSLGKNTPFTGDVSKGISVVLLNTQKGEAFWEETREEFFSEERPFEEAIQGNTNLRRPSIPHKNREKFFELYPRVGYKKAMKKVLINDRVKYLIYDLIHKNRLIMRLISFLRG